MTIVVFLSGRNVLHTLSQTLYVLVITIIKILVNNKGPQSYVAKYAASFTPSMSGILTAGSYPARAPLYYVYGLNQVINHQI